jgi:hypothetical protein
MPTTLVSPPCSEPTRPQTLASRRSHIARGPVPDIAPSLRLRGARRAFAPLVPRRYPQALAHYSEQQRAAFCGTAMNDESPLPFILEGFLKHQGPSFEGPWLVAGAGFEPATFGL